ncbi:hypothetical protein D3C72_1135980 [compost metagenome]
MLLGLGIAVQIPHPTAGGVAGADGIHLARIERQILTGEVALVSAGFSIGVAGVDAYAIQRAVQFAEIVAERQLDTLVLGGAHVGPADIVADVLQLVIEIDIEQRGLGFDDGVVITGTEFIGMGFFRRQARRGLVAVAALGQLEVLHAAERGVGVGEQLPGVGHVVHDVQ